MNIKKMVADDTMTDESEWAYLSPDVVINLFTRQGATVLDRHNKRYVYVYNAVPVSFPPRPQSISI